MRHRVHLTCHVLDKSKQFFIPKTNLSQLSCYLLQCTDRKKCKKTQPDLTEVSFSKKIHPLRKQNNKFLSAMETFTFSDYECIGFDLDSTILMYNERNLMSLVYNVIADFLVDEKGYDPRYLKQPLSENDLDFLQKGLFLDFHNGNILKLTPDGKVHRASHGTKLLNDDQIQKYYPNRQWEPSNIVSKNPLAMWDASYIHRIRTLLCVFDTPAGLAFAKAVDTLDKENDGPLNEYNIWTDIQEAFSNMYSRDNFRTGTGKFSSEFRKNPEKYIHKCDKKTLDWIRKLRERKKTFLVTGSYIDFAELTTNYAFDNDWKSIFDIIICSAKKPSFFTGATPFYSLKDNLENEILSSEQLQVGGIYSSGNWGELVKFFSQLTGKANPQCLYVGDNLLQDVYAPNLVGCDTLAISAEQLAERIDGVDLSHEYEDIFVSKFWGSFFVLKNSDNCIESFWNHIIKKHSKICVPQLEMITDKFLEDPIECFAQEDEDKELCGYYPSKPISTSNLK